MDNVKPSEQRVDLEQEIPLDVQDCDTASAKELFGGRPTALIPTREGLDTFALKITAENFCRERQLTAAKAENAKQAEQIREARELLEGIATTWVDMDRVDAWLSQTAPPKDTPSEGIRHD